MSPSTPIYGIQLDQEYKQYELGERNLIQFLFYIKLQVYPPFPVVIRGELMYIAYRCEKCKTTIIVPIEDIKRMESEGRFINCIFGHRDIRKLDQYEDIKECMNHSHYKRSNGAIKQIG